MIDMSPQEKECGFVPCVNLGNKVIVVAAEMAEIANIALSSPIPLQSHAQLQLQRHMQYHVHPQIANSFVKKDSQVVSSRHEAFNLAESQVWSTQYAHDIKRMDGPRSNSGNDAKKRKKAKTAIICYASAIVFVIVIVIVLVQVER
jgi:hypothetical protein